MFIIIGSLGKSRSSFHLSLSSRQKWNDKALIEWKLATNDNILSNISQLIFFLIIKKLFPNRFPSIFFKVHQFISKGTVFNLKKSIFHLKQNAPLVVEMTRKYFTNELEQKRSNRIYFRFCLIFVFLFTLKVSFGRKRNANFYSFSPKRKNKQRQTEKTKKN